ncbi:hypothetical protein ACFO5X_12965 [Seohaeicola nanhaiensis]|uniref:HTH luxR-type domain-containing protein n=1 Tax=Seohaeicola nanhaiensis TaxID=1387282 RepID=A0ABV9KIQ9_9RHOB
MPDPTPHSPTDDSRRQVSTMVAFGIPQDKIAVIIGISAPTMRKYYREVINVADAKALSVLAKFLFSAATGEALRTGATHADCIQSAMFWMKTRAGWKETSAHEHTGPNGQDLHPPKSEFETARRVAFLLARAQHHLDDPAECSNLVDASARRIMGIVR